MEIINVLHRLDGVYVVDASDYDRADMCLLSHEFGAVMLDPMTYRAKTRGHELVVTEEPDPEAEAEAEAEAGEPSAESAG